MCSSLRKNTKRLKRKLVGNNFTKNGLKMSAMKLFLVSGVWNIPVGARSELEAETLVSELLDQEDAVSLGLKDMELNARRVESIYNLPASVIEEWNTCPVFNTDDVDCLMMKDIINGHDPVTTKVLDDLRVLVSKMRNMGISEEDIKKVL